MADPTKPAAKPKTLEELYPGISTSGPTEEEAAAALSSAYPGMVTGPTTGDAAKEVLLGAGQGLVRTGPMAAGGDTRVELFQGLGLGCWLSGVCHHWPPFFCA